MARFWRRTPTATTQTSEERVEAVPPPPPRPFWPWLLLLLALVVGALAASWYFATRDETVQAKRVPDVVGLRRDVAEQQVEERGFEVEIKPVTSPRRPGTVVAQRPEPRALYGRGGIVVLSLARNPLKVEVPDVTGLPFAQALERLRAAGLQPRAQPVSSRRPKGRVVRQLPEAGTEVMRGSAALVLFSTGPKLANVPDVVGLTAEEATTRLTTAGFRTRVDRVASSQPEGTVVAQRPPGGRRAQRGGVVRINVSNGPGQTTTTVVTTTTTSTQGTVPDTVGMDESTATFTLEDAGYRVRVRNRPVSDPSQDGIVVQQIPAGGTRRTGSTVTIIVGIIR